MDIGDIFQLLFLGFLLFSVFGGLFSRGGNKEEAPGPRDISQSGGEPPRPRPRQAPPRPAQERQMPTTATEWWEELTGQRQATPPPVPQPSQRPVPAAHEQRWETETLDRPTRHKKEVRERYGVPGTRSYDDALEGDRGAHLEARAAEARRRYGTEDDRSALLERDITMDRDPESRPRRQAAPAARGRRSDAAILRDWLSDPDTLGRAFIVKEVIGEPLSLRKEQ